jgi:hypothetical protein
MFPEPSDLLHKAMGAKLTWHASLFSVGHLGQDGLQASLYEGPLGRDGQRYSNSVMTVSIFNKLVVTVLVNLFAIVLVGVSMRCM